MFRIRYLLPLALAIVALAAVLAARGGAAPSDCITQGTVERCGENALQWCEHEADRNDGTTDRACDFFARLSERDR